MRKYKCLVSNLTIEEVGIEAASPALAHEKGYKREWDETNVIRTQDQMVEEVTILGYWDEQGTYHDIHEDAMSEQEFTADQRESEDG
jgi:hypothetical protein